MKRVLIASLVLVSFVSMLNAAIIANTATVLPQKTFSVTGGAVLGVNPFGYNTFFVMAGMGLGNSMDVNVKYIYQDFIGADLELNLIKNPDLFNLSADLGVNYRWTASVVGGSVNLLLSRKFLGILDPYLSVEYGLGYALTPGTLGHTLDAVIGIDIKIIDSLSFLVEFDYPILGGGPTLTAGLCFYTGDKPLF